MDTYHISRDRVGEKHATSVDLFDVHFDESLLPMMRPHQIAAARFLLLRLLGEDHSSITKQPISPPDRKTQEIDIPLTGAILADDVGTGKTLTALSVLWALCRNGKGKGLVVCPSSLVENWRKEISRWFPKNLARSALFITGSNRSSGPKGTDAIVSEFISSHPAIHPVLVLSYDMFRIYSDYLNDMTCLNTIICDEGHRLKNAYGTKTTLALGNCCAMQRLALTGTPLQNNLDELYAVVQFVAPGYLGTLKEFQDKYSKLISHRGLTHVENISSSKEAKAIEELRTKLSRILLRRNRDTILKAALLKRSTVIVACRMSASQESAYMAECRNVLTSFGTACELRPEEFIAEYGITDEIDTGCGDSKSSDRSTKRKAEGVDKAEGSVDRAVLASLIVLRQICSGGEPSTAFSPPGSAAVPGAPTTAAEALARRDEAVARSLCNSVKLRVLEGLLASIRASRPQDRVVVVSNFISTLDSIQMLARARRYLLLRIDGTTAADKRQRAVDHFNNPAEPFFLMLLSTRAGGVGLNLTGANHLVLWEPDWNPATDDQAMGRVWRDGQAKEVFIYRFVASGTIEETMLHRQYAKSKLHGVLQEMDVAITHSSGESTGCSKSRKRKSISESDGSLAPRVSLEQMVMGSRLTRQLQLKGLAACSEAEEILGTAEGASVSDRSSEGSILPEGCPPFLAESRDVEYFVCVD